MKRLFIAYAVCFILLSVGCRSEQQVDVENSFRTESFESEPYRLELSFPEGSLEFGSLVEINLNLEYPEGESYILLPFETEKTGMPSNVVIRSVSETDPVADGSGKLRSNIKIEIEAYLPGSMVFPAMTVRFDRDIITDEILFDVKSAFDDSAQKNDLAPIYIPETGTGKNIKLLIGAIFAAAVFVVFIIIFLLRRRERKKIPESVLPRTREERLADFRKLFLDTAAPADFREAFTELERIYELSPPDHPAVMNRERYKNIFREARFSKEGITTENGIDVLRQIYIALCAGGGE